MRISPELWAEVKRQERAVTGPDSLGRLHLKVRTAGRNGRGELERDLADLGGEVSSGSPGGWLKVSAPVSRAPAVALLPGVRQVDPARAGWEPAGRRPLFAAVALLVAMGLAWAAWQSLEPAPLPKPPVTPDPTDPRNQGGNPPNNNGGSMYAGLDKAKTPPAAAARGGEAALKREVVPAEPLPAASTAPLQPGELEASPAPGVSVDDLYQRGLTAYQEGRVEDAVRAWRAAVNRDPGRLGIRHSLGWALYELGMRTEAISEFLTILHEHPDDPDAVAAVELIQGESEPGVATEGSVR